MVCQKIVSPLEFVMAGLDPAIQTDRNKSWMAASGAAMTN